MRVWRVLRAEDAVSAVCLTCARHIRSADLSGLTAYGAYNGDGTLMTLGRPLRGYPIVLCIACAGDLCDTYEGVGS